MNSFPASDPQRTMPPAAWRRAPLHAAESLAQWSRATADFLVRSATLMQMSLALSKSTPTNLVPPAVSPPPAEAG